MERTLLSINVMNVITIGLILLILYVGAVGGRQLYMRMTGG